MFLSIFEEVFWLTIFIFEGVITICCNIIGLVIFSKRAYRSRPCLLLANQCLAYTLVGIEVIYQCFVGYFAKNGIIAKYKETSSSNERCTDAVHIVNAALWALAFEETAITLGLIALERAFAVFKPFKHRVLRKKSYFYVILLSWILTTSQSLMSILPNCYKTNKSLPSAWSAMVVVTVFISVFCLIVSYLAIYVKLRFFPIFQTASHIHNEYKLCRTLFYAAVATFSTCVP